MPTPQAIEDEFWSALKSDITITVGLESDRDEHPRPTTVQLDGRPRANLALSRQKTSCNLRYDDWTRPRCARHVRRQGHSPFATVHGLLNLSDDRAMIDRLWNRARPSEYRLRKSHGHRAPKS